MRAIVDILKLKKKKKTCLQNKYEDKAPLRWCNFNETDKIISLVCTVIFNKHPRSNPNTICKLITKQLYSWYSISHKEVIGKVSEKGALEIFERPFEGSYMGLLGYPISDWYWQKLSPSYNHVYLSRKIKIAFELAIRSLLVSVLQVFQM